MPRDVVIVLLGGDAAADSEGCCSLSVTTAPEPISEGFRARSSPRVPPKVSLARRPAPAPRTASFSGPASLTVRHKLVWRKRALLLCLANNDDLRAREGGRRRENFKLFASPSVTRSTLAVANSRSFYDTEFWFPKGEKKNLAARCRPILVLGSRRARLSFPTREESSRAGVTLSARKCRRRLGVQHHDRHSDTAAGPGERARVDSPSPTPLAARAYPGEARQNEC